MVLPRDYLTMNSSEYKRYHQKFMQHNSGSSPMRTLSFILLVVFCTVISSMFRSRSKSVQYISEYLIIVLPMILGHTVLSDYIVEMNYIAVAVCVIIVLNARDVRVISIFSENNSYQSERLLSVMSMRGLTYLITAFSILGVDFRIYPRYMAKTEKYGFSVMDTGVGLFVLMSGLVHKDYGRDKIRYFIKDNFKLFAVLSVLGITRFLSIKHLDYHEHVTEYGVHWNFFFTLAVTKVASSVILYLFNSKDYRNYRIIKLSVAVIILHEIMIYVGLGAWVFSDAPRDSMISANREGMSSCLGYIALYLVAVHFKHLLLDKSLQRFSVLWKLFAGAHISCVAFILYHYFYSPISRTLANFAYWSYLIFILQNVLLLLYLFEVLLEKDQEYFLTIPIILSDINYNGLLFFLSANLLTGAVNLWIRTLFVDSFTAIVILNVYMISTITIAAFLKRKQVKLI